MAGFASLSEIKALVDKGHGRFVARFYKTTQTMIVGRVNNRYSLAGFPAAGTNPSAGLAGAVALSKTSTGALYFPAAPAGTNNYIWKASMSRVAITAAVGGLTIVCDRLAHANVALNQANGSFSPVINGTSRLASGEGGQIICIVTTAASAASNTFSLTYTNQAGTSGRTTDVVTTIASAAAGSTPYARYIYVPLQAGDTGVRSIEGWTLNSGTATGNINIIIVKPLVCLDNNIYCNETEIDYSVMVNGMSMIHDSAFIDVYTLAGATTNSAPLGSLTIISK